MYSISITKMSDNQSQNMMNQFNQFNQFNTQEPVYEPLTKEEFNNCALDFKKYGKVVSFNEILQMEEEYRCSLTEPPQTTFLWGNDIKVYIPLQVIQQIIEDEIEKIEEKFIFESIKEAEHIAGQFFMVPVRPHDNLISITNVVKRNPFDWTIEIQHEMPQRREGWTDEIYELLKRQKELHGKIEVRIYANNENKGFEKFYVYINRLCGRTPVYYDFHSSLKNKLKEIEKEHKNFILRKGLIQLMEGTQYKPDEETCITRYLLNEYVVREICSFLPEEDSEKNKAYGF